MASLISSSSTDQAWRQERYHRFYEVVDRVVAQLLCLPNEDGSVSQDAAPSTDVAPMPKVGRNDACPCGSGKKFKLCHGRLA